MVVVCGNGLRPLLCAIKILDEDTCLYSIYSADYDTENYKGIPSV